MNARHSSSFSFKGFADDGGVLVGLASTFGGAPDSYGDVIAPGAFAKSLAAHKERDTVPAMLWAHDMREPVGRWLSLEEDRIGLRVEGKLTLGSRRGAEAHALAKDGALALSIGYEPTESRMEGQSRVLTEIKLHEVSLVALPANPAARILSVKSSPRDMEQVLRDLGLSSRQAKRFMAEGYSGLTGDDFDDTELREAEALARLNNMIQRYS